MNVAIPMYSQIFDNYMQSDYFQDEVMLAWGSLFFSENLSEENKNLIKNRLERLLQMPEQIKSNWELGFASSVYLYVLKQAGVEMDGQRIYEMLRDANFYKIPGVPELPAFLGFTFAMFGKECEGECKLYYLFFKRLNNEIIDEAEIDAHSEHGIVESLLSDYLKGRKPRKRVKVLKASEDGMLIQVGKEQRFVSKEMVFLLLFIDRSLGCLSWQGLRERETPFAREG